MADEYFFNIKSSEGINTKLHNHNIGMFVGTPKGLRVLYVNDTFIKTVAQAIEDNDVRYSDKDYPKIIIE